MIERGERNLFFINIVVFVKFFELFFFELFDFFEINLYKEYLIKNKDNV